MLSNKLKQARRRRYRNTSRKWKKAKFLPLILSLHKEGKSPRVISQIIKTDYGYRISHVSVWTWIRESNVSAQEGALPLPGEGLAPQSESSSV